MLNFSLVSGILSFQLLFGGSFVVDGPSMEPTLYDGDVFLIEPVWNADDYERGDVVVFSLEDDPDYFYVKRIIGLPGEELQIRSNGVYADNVRLSEPYLVADTSSVPGVSRYVDDFVQTYNVPAGHFFVLGDNREQSLDSRHFENPYVGVDRLRGRFVVEIFEEEKPTVWSTVVINTDDGRVPFSVEVAETQDQRMQGLMNRESLERGFGMYFIFDEEANRAFWMKNTLIPLDMIFIDDQGYIVHIVKRAQPCKRERCLTYPSKFPAKYVLEIGALETNVFGVEIGDRVEFIRGNN